MTKIDVYCHKISSAGYPMAPYAPSRHYPELDRFGFKYSCEDNQVYDAVRELLHQLGYDSENYGTLNWNPLKNFVKKSGKIFIKPNMVFHEHPCGEKEVLSMVTNAAVIRPIIDYILLAAESEIEITIGDCPVQTANFDEVSRISGIAELCSYYEKMGVHIKLTDMRMVLTDMAPNGMKGEKRQNPRRNLDEYVYVDLKEKSELDSILHKNRRLEITDYPRRSVEKHHSRLKNEYLIPKEVLEADTIINVPKLKTHRKAGVTCALKNLVGINGDKTCIAHHMRGNPRNGGDEFDKFYFIEWFKVRVWTFLKESKAGTKIAGIIKYFFQKYVWHGASLKEHNMTCKPACFSEGNWSGNDTIWRCVKDLNKIVLYADKNGVMQSSIQRKYLCVVDAILAGEGEGPMEQTTKRFNVLLGGENPVYVDYAATKLMQFRYKDIPIVSECFENKWWDLVHKEAADVNIQTNVPFSEIAEKFVPPFGWRDKLGIALKKEQDE